MITRLRARMADRNGLPGWLNAVVDHIADHPNGVIGKLVARRLGRPDSAAQTPTSTFPERSRRLLIAPVNYSGQGTEWARSVENADPSIAARSMAIDVPGGFSYSADLIVPVPVYHNDRDWQQRQFAAASSATHVLVEAEEPPFGRLMGRNVARQVDALLAAGVDVAFMCHGTDIRLPSRHIQRTPWSMYRDPSVYVPRLEELARRNRELLDRFARPVFVSTPDLLADVDGGTWCPVVVDPKRWRRPAAARPDGPLRVAHAPSVSTLKGTPLIMPALERLQDQGVIDYRLISGVASEQMPAAYHDADIVLDQFRAGSYGVAACEAMAAGCLVIGYVLEEVRETVVQRVGRALPIIEATADTLEQVLRGIARDREQIAPAQRRSIEFVREVHDGRVSASILIDNWLVKHR